ncbi:prepilin peptidase [Mesorhizobium sp. WSM4313]|uniref:prepilin peptidase n=1 Tax=Mesorhizobium sp. WSM4313 TaxID=2029412 RepID=UPI000BAE8248|nr:prepilin peptidase [Mesorhizobium sp. WSM4313]PBB20491.1 prepilin peptidase [Mesorhizobium sp. WSM4313]
MLVAALLVRALTIPLLAKIAWVDFTTQKIANRDVLMLLCLGLGSLQLVSVQAGSWWDMGLDAIAGLVLFIAFFPFWVLRKVGAGDVKLMAVTPFLIGGSDLAVFSVLLLVFAIGTATVAKNPFLLPAGMFRYYAQRMDRKGVVPLGVPISAAAICTIVLQVYSAMLILAGIVD